MNKALRTKLNHLFASGESCNDEKQRKRLDAILDALKVLYNNDEYDIFVAQRAMYLVGADVHNVDFTCAVCHAPISDEHEVFHSTEGNESISIYQCKRCKQLVFAKFPAINSKE